MTRAVDVAGNLEAKAPKEILCRWLLALGCFALLLFFFSPAWGAFRAWARAPEMGFMIETRRGVVVLDKWRIRARRSPIRCTPRSSGGSCFR